MKKWNFLRDTKERSISCQNRIDTNCKTRNGRNLLSFIIPKYFKNKLKITRMKRGLLVFNQDIMCLIVILCVI